MRAAALLALLLAPPVAAQGTHVLIVTGLGGEPAMARAFVDAGMLVHETAKSRWGVADSSLIWLAEDPAAEPARIRGKATKGAIDSAFTTLTRRAKPGDVLLVLLVGHGSGEGAMSRVNLPGADPTAGDWGLWLDLFQAQQVVAIVAASGSGDFVPTLKAPNRVVISAVKSATERNASIFGTWIARGLASGEADGDKDGRISALEAFDFARANVRKIYESDNRLLSEHAQLDDDGDGKGSAAPGVGESTDGQLAKRIAFGGKAASADPRVAALVAERSVLERQVDELRRKKATMDEATYERELERLLLAVAEKTQAIRAIEPGKTP